jgi:DnaJ-domain-containing protein 1
MTTKDDLRSFSDKAHARIDTLTSQYRAAIKEGNHAMAAVLQGERSSAISYAQAIEDCRGLLR